MGFDAVVLAGGTAARLGGMDKASVEYGGRTLLTWALDAVLDAAEVVVVGDPVPTSRPVSFVREDPRHGGPAAALLTGRDLLATMRSERSELAVLACDMPFLTCGTFRRLRTAAQGRDGAVLCAPDGRRALAYVLDVRRLDAVRPPYDEQHNLALRRLLAPLDLAEVASVGREHADIDSWADLRDLLQD